MPNPSGVNLSTMQCPIPNLDALLLNQSPWLL
jgi:hypothetical protein